MTNPTLRAVRRFISSHDIIHPQETVVVAVSGGADSLALLHLLFDLHRVLAFDLHVAHLNHGLRTSSINEADYVVQQARNLGLSYTVENLPSIDSLTAESTSVEANLRHWRYQFLDRVADRLKAEKIALGHHIDDQAETILLKLLRGAGGTGLGGMLPVRDGRYVRPLLCLRRLEIKKYLGKKKIEACQDESNEDYRFLRNRIRHELLPILSRDYNPNIPNILSNTANLIQTDEDFLHSQTQDALLKCQIGRHKFDRLSFLRLHPALQRRLIRLIYFQIVGHKKDLYFTHVHSMIDLLSANRPNVEIYLPFQILFRRSYDEFSLKRLATKNQWFEKQLQLSDINQIPTGILVSQLLEDRIRPMPDGLFSAVFDMDQLELPLFIRNRKEGDRFYPFGLNGSKKVKDFLMDQKVPKHLRDQIPILVDKKHQILWIIGYRTSQIGCITESTQRILKIDYEVDSAY